MVGCWRPQHVASSFSKAFIANDSSPRGFAVTNAFKSDLSKRIALLGAPIDIGASQRGTLMGPAALRTAGLLTLLDGLGFEVEDHGDLPIRRAAEPPDA